MVEKVKVVPIIGKDMAAGLKENVTDLQHAQEVGRKKPWASMPRSFRPRAPALSCNSKLGHVGAKRLGPAP
eukprot:10593541-Alexandrium_andersonii.AAC.1